MGTKRVWGKIAKNCKVIKDERVYTCSQLAQILECSPDLIDKWVRKGIGDYKLSYIKKGKNGRLYSGIDILEFLSNIEILISKNIYITLDNIPVEDKDGAILLIPIGTKIKILL